jgi:putative ABC transport system permease protein
LTGITNDYFKLFNLELGGGNMFSEKHHNYGDQVCIIGENIAHDFFVDENPLGNWLKCGHLWLKVIGVIRQKNVNADASDNLGITNHNKMVFAPIQTVFLRYNDRSAVQVSENNRSSSNSGSGKIKVVHQLDKLVVQVDESKHLKTVSKVLKRLLMRRHNSMKDFEIIIPELLLKQEQRTRDIFNIVLGAIASISLIVGGIGIMNIMLASVTERTKEIGIRLAIGARKKDVVVQFISEATFISLVGGFFGIFLGALLASLISRFADIPTIISLVSILVSFGVSAGIGILFGYMPAKKAAHKDPVTSLRYE